jgi:hypothetical protein
MITPATLEQAVSLLSAFACSGEERVELVDYHAWERYLPGSTFRKIAWMPASEETSAGVVIIEDDVHVAWAHDDDKGVWVEDSSHESILLEAAAEIAAECPDLWRHIIESERLE